MSVFDGMADIITGALGADAPVYLVRPGKDRMLVPAVFRQEYRPVDGGEIGLVEGRLSAASIRTEDAHCLPGGYSHLDHKGYRYKIDRAEPDRAGMTLLVLKAAGLSEDKA